MPTNAEVRDRVSAAVVEALERGVSPWRQPWSRLAGGSPRPHNAASGHLYRGVNCYLWAVQQAHGYGSSGFVTFRQAKALGGSVRKGERASWVVFAKPQRVKAAPNDPQADAEGFKKLFLYRVTPVFNTEQCDELALPDREQPKHGNATVAGDALIAQTLALAEQRGIAVALGGDRACFDIGANIVRLPKPEAFESAATFAATAMHEYVHATGHETRLARTFGTSFGDADYSREELVAEMGAAMCCARLGIDGDKIESHAAYLKHFVELLKADNKALFAAARGAEAAMTWLLGEEKAEAEMADAA
jgi:antirestriction protein ArdC